MLVVAGRTSAPARRLARSSCVTMPPLYPEGALTIEQSELAAMPVGLITVTTTRGAGNRQFNGGQSSGLCSVPSSIAHAARPHSIAFTTRSWAMAT